MQTSHKVACWRCIQATGMRGQQTGSARRVNHTCQPQTSPARWSQCSRLGLPSHVRQACSPTCTRARNRDAQQIVVCTSQSARACLCKQDTCQPPMLQQCCRCKACKHAGCASPAPALFRLCGQAVEQGAMQAPLHQHCQPALPVVPQVKLQGLGAGLLTGKVRGLSARHTQRIEDAAI